MRSLNKGENIKSLAQKEKLSLNRVELDISDDIAVKNAIQSITAESCRIDVLVNNAFLSDASPYNSRCIDKGYEVLEHTVLPSGPKPPTPFWQIAQYLSERGFAVLRYDKRGIGANFTINQNVWGNTTINVAGLVLTLLEPANQ
jgi:NAD(P)-dependent dehydrogenase (short-subunit alcohol dehydrogenase family)